MASPTEPLKQLAELYNVQTSYYDVVGELKQAAPEALLEVLRILGAPLSRIADAPAALRQRRQEIWRCWAEPVTLAWDGGQADLVVRLPQAQAHGPLRCTLRLEEGPTKDWTSEIAHLPTVREEEVEGVRYLAKRLFPPQPLPWGYHRLTLERAGVTAEGLLISAPLRAYEPPGGGQKTWGVFAPLYALHSERSWGAGDFSDLERLTEWVASLGGGMVATLPLLAAFLEEPFEPGPYSPASRLFWNEFYLDVSPIPELQRSPTARALLAAPEFQKEIQDLRQAPLVDYQRQMALKRRVLTELARTFFADPGSRGSAFQQFLTSRPNVEDYARFRAVGERRKAPWPTWPAPLRDGVVKEGDYDEEAKRYHLYVQWQADEQLQALAARARTAGSGFYLDLPLGVNPDSYDVWRERSAFATGIAAGAPPDPFFARGQDWGFPPLHPERIREQGYRHVIGYVRHHLRLAGVLRIDHMMGFHRLFWVPRGMGALEGVYVTYPAGELYAVFNLESHRHRSVLVGEDLGTVPEYVRPAMAHHNIHRMYVLQYELQPQYSNALNPVYPGSVASLNTHDMPPFNAFWQDLDVQDRVELGILDQTVGDEERKRRKALREALVQSLKQAGQLKSAADVRGVLRACLTYMAAGSPLVALVTLEDLWLETQPQNMPGTWRERPNWRRRAKYSLEAMSRMPEVLDLLRQVDQVTKKR
jgi:4-alpha-glucanotransferase